MLYDVQCDTCNFVEEVWVLVSELSLLRCSKCHNHVRIVPNCGSVKVSLNIGEVRNVSWSYEDADGKTVHNKLPNLEHV